MQKFFTDTIQGRFIKSLLYNTPLPIYKSIRYNDYITAGSTYVWKHSLIKCTSTGYFGNGAEYYTLCPYEFGKYYPKYTSRHISKDYYYDSDTHRKLGEYLRYYRDIYGIDLMPLYNCYTGEYLNNMELLIDEQIKTHTIETKHMVHGQVRVYNNPSYKVVKIPIKFNQKYTVAIDSSTMVLISGTLLLRNNIIDITDMSELQTNIYQDIYRFSSMSFKHPQVIEFKNTGDDAFTNEMLERNLYMLIQIPVSNYTSIVVLEGDYTDIGHTNTISMETTEDGSFNELNNEDLNNILLSNLSLLQFNCQENYPYADRLIEYLLQNVVDSNDVIGNNIKDIQKTFNYSQQQSYLDSVWTTKLRKDIYNKSFNDKRNKKLDLMGFVDKDTEKSLRSN